jgi:hypothetical protein
MGYNKYKYKIINFGIFAFYIIGIYCFLYVFFEIGRSNPSSEQVSHYSGACIRFYKEAKELDKDTHVEYGSYWKKDGRVVFSLVIKKRKNDTIYHEAFCVVDLKNGKMFLPSVFSQDRWEK